MPQTKPSPDLLATNALFGACARNHTKGSIMMTTQYIHPRRFEMVVGLVESMPLVHSRGHVHSTQVDAWYGVFGGEIRVEYEAERPVRFQVVGTDSFVQPH